MGVGGTDGGFVGLGGVVGRVVLWLCHSSDEGAMVMLVT